MAILQAANATVLPTHAAQSLSSVPSKLISYLFAERPVVGVALEASETAAIIRRSGSGVVVRPDDPRALAAAIRDLTSRAPEALAQMGKSGRNWALANMTRDVCLPPLLNIIRGTTLQRIR
jgi:glycosyltransferase involved in cell wall biosynthesis